jgi:hypothetical protein
VHGSRGLDIFVEKIVVTTKLIWPSLIWSSEDHIANMAEKRKRVTDEKQCADLFAEWDQKLAHWKEHVKKAKCQLTKDDLWAIKWDLCNIPDKLREDLSMKQIEWPLLQNVECLISSSYSRYRLEDRLVTKFDAEGKSFRFDVNVTHDTDELDDTDEEEEEVHRHSWQRDREFKISRVRSINRSFVHRKDPLTLEWTSLKLKTKKHAIRMMMVQIFCQTKLNDLINVSMLYEAFRHSFGVV